MNMNHLRYFVEVCKNKSFTKTSEVIHVSQPAITAAIKELENELGLRLFDRINNRACLTSEGTRFLAMTKEMLDYFDNFYNETLDLGRNRKMELRVGVPAVLGAFFLKKIVPDFERENPDSRLIIHETPTITGLEMVENASLDFLIGIVDEELPPNCDHKKIFDTNLVLFLSRKNPLSKEKSISSEMLINQPFIMVPKGSSQYKMLTSEFKGVPINIVLHSTQVATIRYMLENNLAVSILYKQVFETDDVICSVPLSKPIIANICIFWKKGIYMSSAMKGFISFVEKIENQENAKSAKEVQWLQSVRAAVPQHTL